MKKVLYYICISVALYTFISCSNEQDFYSGPKGNTKISVSIDNHTTRVSVDHLGKTVWSKGDEISVYTTRNRFQTFTLDGNGGNKTGQFTGYLDPDEEIVDYAVYPAGNHKISNGELQVNMPKQYEFKSGDALMPLVAHMNRAATSLSFEHVSGLLSCTIQNVPSTAKGLMLVTDKKLVTGDFKLSNQVISAQNTGGKDTVRLSLKEEPKSQMTFNIPLPTGTYDKLSIVLTNADGNPISTTLKSSTIANTIIAGSVLQLPSYKILGPEFYVKVDGTGDGSSWDDAMSGERFREMVNSKAFSKGDIIYMAAGTYYTGTTANVNNQNALTDHMKFCTGITVYGGFPANSTGKTHTISYPSAHETIFSGDLNHNGTPDEGDCHLIHVEMIGNQTITFNGVTFKNGFIGNTLSDQLRPGVYVSGDGTDVHFNYCKILNNVSKINGSNAAGGAAIGIWRGNVTLYRCEVSGNKSHDRGGAIRLISNSPKLLIDQCLFHNNSTEWDWGGCIQGSTTTGSIVINNSTFYENTTGNGGGAINGSSAMYISNSTFVNNSCNSDPQDFRTEGSEKHYSINSIIVGSRNQVTGNKANIYVNNNSFTSQGYTVYGTKGGAGTFKAGNGDITGRYTEDIFGTPSLTNQGGATSVLKPLNKINGASLSELNEFKLKFKDIIPETFDLTIDQRGKKRQATTSVGAYEFD